MNVPRVITPPADLELRVQTTSIPGKTRLTYTLHSPSGVVPFTYQEIQGPTLLGSPEEFHHNFLGQIENLGNRLDTGGRPVLSDEVYPKLVGMGRWLWQQLFNDEMRQAYRHFRDEVHTLLVISDEPWIPWEMIKPYDDRGETLDDEFFAEKFAITRWLAGSRAAPGKLAVAAVACIVGDGRLPLASKERALVTNLVRSTPGLQDASPDPAGLAPLLSSLAGGGIGLVHLIGHGTLDLKQPNEAGFLMADGSVFRPVDLHGPVQTQIGRDRPLVLLNACGSGRQGWSLTRLGGWAHRWVRLCGCGAFIGPHWPVRDAAAYAFAQGLYTSLERQQSLGQAAMAARRAAREANPKNPSWLAYAVYGHPNAQVAFGAEAGFTNVTLV